MTDRLYVVVRSDLPAGLQMAQACHAALAWREQHGQAPENLVVLNVPSDADVYSLLHCARERGIRRTLFREPDLDNAATAIAFGGEARPLLSSLPLALKDWPA